jgi:hypothetical protein
LAELLVNFVRLPVVCHVASEIYDQSIVSARESPVGDEERTQAIVGCCPTRVTRGSGKTNERYATFSQGIKLSVDTKAGKTESKDSKK